MLSRTRQIKIEEKTFDLTVNFRRQKSFSLALSEPYKLRLNIPLFHSEASGIRFLYQRQSWILRKNAELLARVESSYLYNGGDEVYFLGKKLQYVILSGEEKIVVNDDTLCFYTHKRTPETIRSAFYQAALPYLQMVCEEYREDLEGYLCSKGYYLSPDIQFKIYKRRWGVCYPTRNRIILNPYLVHFPLNCIYYVYLHEMVHFLYPNHSKEFYKAVSEKMPNFKEVVSMLH